MKKLIRYIRSQLSDLYSPEEIQALSSIIIEHVTGYTPVQQHLHKNNELPETLRQQIYQIVSELRNHVPIQHIMGYTLFYDCKIYTTPDALIPRPETEELVEHVITYLKDKKQLKVLDIGTGTGCIPVALAKNIPNHLFSAIDVSEQALALAQKNIQANDVNVALRKVDILNFENYNWTEYDVIVSNPPYIEESRREKLDKNVAAHDPELALFVPDTDPLIFYRRIAEFAQLYLRPKGAVFCEINEEFGKETLQLFNNMEFKNTKLIQDINQKDRIVYAEK